MVPTLHVEAGVEVVTDAVRLRADATMSAGRLIARQTAPYFRSLMLKLVPHEMPGLGTVGVTKSGVLLFDPDEVAAWDPVCMAGVLLHGVMHLWLGHFDRVGTRDPARFNRAGDRAINPGILELGLRLPRPRGLPYCLPKDVGLPDGLTADEYYDADVPKQGDDGDGEDEGQSARSGVVGGGHCGSCSGHALDGEPTDAESAGRAPEELARAAKVCSEAMVSVASGKQAGRVPGSWYRLAKMHLELPRVPWQRKLTAATRRAVAYRPGSVDHRYDAPSRRQSGLGYGEGCPVLPRLRQPIPEVAVVFDTSGSMGEDVLGDAARETDGILKAVGAKVTVCVCDETVHGIGRVKSIREALAMLKGGGGTDFRPAFRELENARPRPQVIVFFTDGYGTAPNAPPPGVRVLWVLVGAMVRTPASWGEVIRVEGDKT